MNRTFFRFVLMLSVMPLIFWVSESRSSEGELVVRSKFPLDNEFRKTKRETKQKSGFEKNSENVKRHRDRRSLCDSHQPCFSSPYRTIDGTCNNLAHSYWGSSNRPFNRFLPSKYEDGFGSPRGTDKSIPLPRSRDVSVTMTNTIVSSSPDDSSLMLMQWGQFLDHDFAFTTNDADPGGLHEDVPCCDDFIDTTRTSSSCLPIDVTNDPFYGSLGLNCLPFVRSTHSFCLWPPEQINEQTAYIDGSQVYGPNNNIEFNVRLSGSWKLKSGPGNENCAAPCLFDFLPVQNNPKSGAEEFFGGDKRVEEQPGLTSIHTLFVRMHNHLGQIIRDENSGYSDEEVYQETRKIVGAVIQQITFDEFLPMVLGNTLMIRYNLILRNPANSDPYFYGYNSSVDATIANVFATAVFRFGHSLINDFFALPDGVSVNLAHSFNNHLVTTDPSSFPSHFLRGICVDPAQEMDHILVSAVQNFLLAKSPFTHGSDLYSRNIERGRDHGLPPYIDWVNACLGLKNAISHFDELSLLMPNETVDALKNIYWNRLEEIDIFPAGIAEHKVSGGLIGQTFACILAEMFHRLKVGDRYWFENPSIFTRNQLKDIRKTKLSTLICKYTDAQSLPENVMKITSSTNPIKPCNILRDRGVIRNISVNW